ncbi:helix-hairpin-helix domain-containing protein [Nocardiopsis sp. NPDC057823]|uniref:helix-hairpin-helix domain-containing protein n=1 Tax=Nocardiopsis sp. NPDC057823 TaxID=3346256 RepID=UPI00366D5DE3
MTPRNDQQERLRALGLDASPAARRLRARIPRPAPEPAEGIPSAPYSVDAWPERDPHDRAPAPPDPEPDAARTVRTPPPRDPPPWTGARLPHPPLTDGTTERLHPARPRPDGAPPAAPPWDTRPTPERTRSVSGPAPDDGPPRAGGTLPDHDARSTAGHPRNGRTPTLRGGSTHPTETPPIWDTRPIPERTRSGSDPAAAYSLSYTATPDHDARSTAGRPRNGHGPDPHNGPARPGRALARDGDGPTPDGGSTHTGGTPAGDGGGPGPEGLGTASAWRRAGAGARRRADGDPGSGVRGGADGAAPARRDGEERVPRVPSGYTEFLPQRGGLVERLARRWPPEATMSRRAVAALLVVALAAVAAVLLLRERPAEVVAPETVAHTLPAEAATPSAAAASPEADVVVHVGGEVEDPGLYTLPPGSRVADAVEAAGGALPDADMDLLNLARSLVDGEQILVGLPQPEAAAPSADTAGGPLVNINQADEAELETLPRVGEVTAVNIVSYREANGPFTSVDDLLNVDRIGAKTLEEIRPHVTVG